LKESLSDPICSRTTPAGVSAIAAIRCSGRDILKKIKGLLPNLRETRPRRAYLLSFIEDGNFIDEVLFTYFKGPFSYTGEDVIELTFHGNPVIVQRAMEALLSVGFREALPGEFTRRAVINGKIDLVKAEAINAMITSKSEKALYAATRSYLGELSKETDSLRREMIEILAMIEVELNYPEEFESDYVGLNSRVEKLRTRIDDFVKISQNGITLHQGVKTAIVGETNVGKSTLLNALLRKDRAIVSDIPGTTRDTIEEDLNISGYLFRVVDTAGIRTTNDRIEEMGVERTMQAIDSSDLIILLNDTTTSENCNLSNDLIKKGKRIIFVANKADIKPVESDEYDVVISAKTGEGISKLERLMLDRTRDLTEIEAASGIIVSPRQRAKLLQSFSYLGDVLQALEERRTIDIIGTLIEQAIRSLDEIVGRNVTDDLLETIFSEFCVGK
jgi:tRNA modification GTPase